MSLPSVTRFSTGLLPEPSAPSNLEVFLESLSNQRQTTHDNVLQRVKDLDQQILANEQAGLEDKDNMSQICEKIVKLMESKVLTQTSIMTGASAKIFFRYRSFSGIGGISSATNSD